MRNSSFVLSLMALILMTPAVYAEDAASDIAAPSAEVVAEPEAVAVVPSEPAEAPAIVIPEPAIPTPDIPEAVSDNLEFISGEISAMDEATKSVSVRLYGEDETASSEKVLKVSIDENTDITDGVQDRDLKSLTVGTEVDVEYDPASSKATYIFVY